MKFNEKKFKEHLTLNGLSKRTINLYCTNINVFLNNYIKEEELTQENFNKALLELKENIAKSTWNTYLTSLRSLINFLNVDIETPKKSKEEKKIPYFITKEYFETEIIRTAECIFKRNNLRNKALLRFMFETGVRREDILYTKRKNFDLKNKTAKIYVPKNKKERNVYFTEKTKKILENFFSITEENNNAFNINNKRTINYIFDKLKEWLSNNKLHPHCFRHSYATILRQNGCPLEDLKELMGLDSYQTVLRYAHISQSEIKEKYKKYFR